MPDANGRPLFSDFPDADSVERSLVDCPIEWRASLVIWLYAHMYAARLGQSRPSTRDLARLMSRLAAARPGLIIANTVGYALALLAVVAIASAGSGGDGSQRFVVLSAGIVVVGLAVWWTVIRPLGRRGRAMRLVWAARDGDPTEVTGLLRTALELDGRGSNKRIQLTRTM